MSNSSTYSEYTARDVFVHPNNYMYSEFHGEEFLDHYFEDRRSLLQTLFDALKSVPAEQLLGVHELLQRSPECPVTDQIRNLSVASEEVPKWACSSLNLKEVLEGEEVETRSLLESMLAAKAGYNSVTTEVYKALVEKMRRNIEVKRQISERYVKKVRVGKGNIDLIYNYAALAAIFALELSAAKEPHLTNALLKTNDCISAQRDLLSTPREQILAAIAISAETSHIRKLMAEGGLE